VILLPRHALRRGEDVAVIDERLMQRLTRRSA
jgi:hypothetical protein